MAPEIINTIPTVFLTVKFSPKNIFAKIAPKTVPTSLNVPA